MCLPRVAPFLSGIALLMSACSDTSKSPSGETVTDGRVVIDTDAERLGAAVDQRDELVSIEAAAAPNARAYVPPTDYVLTLVAEVAPPVVDGMPLQATSVVYDGKTAAVSYNMAGDARRGAVDLFTFDADRRPTLKSRATFADTDVSAVGVDGERVWLATATEDESFGTPAVLEALGLDASGRIGFDGHVREALSSFAATSVAFADGHVFTTSGNKGGLFELEKDGTLVAQRAFDDARWVTPAGPGVLALVQGTPGRVALVDSQSLDPIAEIPFAGAQLAEAKSTIEVLGGKAFVAGGPGGAFVIDLASQKELADIPIPLGIPNIAPANMVTNAVSADGDLMFVSNGQAGVFLVKSDVALDRAWDPTSALPSFTVVGRLAFAGEVESANHIVYKDGFLFMATGLGGMKIVRVDRVPRTGPRPEGYPYLSHFDDENGQAGWVLDGAWGFGLPDGQRIGNGGAFLDNDPSAIELAGTGPTFATLDVPLELPKQGFAQVSFSYNCAFADPADRVELQVEDFATGVWKTHATFGPQHQRPGMSKHITVLDAYAAGIVRLRFAQTMGPTAGERRFTVDDLEVTEVVRPIDAYPFQTSFESELDRTKWNLEGAWGWQSGDVFNGSAQLAIDSARSLAGFDRMQDAELQSYVAIPTTGHPTLGFWYRAGLLGADAVRVDVQRRGEATWSELTRFVPTQSRSSWGYREVPLDALGDTAVRLRFSLALDATAGARDLRIDDVRIGDLGGPSLPWPWSSALDSAASASEWVSDGMLSVRASDSGNAIVADATIRGASGGGHEARTVGFATIPRGIPAELGLRMKLGLVDPADKVQIAAQDLATGTWTTLATYGLALSHPTWTRYEIPLDAVAGKTVRLRITTSYGPTIGDRTVAFDDVVVGGLPTPRWSYPFTRTADAAALADWSIAGNWAIADGALDANPKKVAQPSQGTGHELVMGGFVALPASGSPLLRLNLDLSLTDASDVVYVELQSAETGVWEPLRAYTMTSNRSGFGWDELPLAAWNGREVRVRVRYQFGAGSGVRRLALRELRIEAPSAVPYAYPWSTGFETTAQASEWALWGAFGIGGTHNGSAPAAGTKFLDGNPGDAIQSNWTLNSATMNGYVALPSNQVSWLGLKHRFGALSSSDWIAIEVQQQGSLTWTQLGLITQEHVRNGYAQLELSLDAYRGKSVRVRFSMWLGASGSARKIGLDELWIGPQPYATVTAPMSMLFSDVNASALWDLSGTWGLNTTTGTLSANPNNVADMKSLTTYQTASYTRFIDLAGVTSPTLALTYLLDLLHTDDRAYIEVLPQNASGWQTLATLNKGNNKSSLTNGRWSLSSWANQKVRVRFRIMTNATSGKRQFTITSFGVTAG